MRYGNEYPIKKGEKPLYICTTITTTPNELTKDVHDRMPVILPPETYDQWLDRKFNDTEILKSTLVPYEADLMDVYPVSDIVNSPLNKSEQCLDTLSSI
ncbi:MULTISPECIES: SOS response-associated peptidase family protein [Metabacillus]|uniref:Abasic site processing protein n=1 Tax=Metabacillus rhizolycopersici TaxID=2875709 RepID=A0ABS7UY38_9BACI|nr:MULTISPECIES: SOS response-associated peptidase family protein [Metabacillus]MBZ5753226.1 SOS response-associated peptidase [Metabacillus rhizolycopersici]MCM3651873.1 SOS response-associated peptidase [Metabacillus litoralis]